MKACKKDENCPFYDLKYQDDCFSFRIMTSPDAETEFCFHFGDFYPAGTIATKIDDGETTSDSTNEPLQILFNAISKEFYHDMDVQCSEDESEESEEKNSQTDTSDYEDFDLYNDDEEDYGLYSFDEDDSNSVSSDTEEADTEITVPEMNSALLHDIEKVKEMFGDDAVQFVDTQQENISLYMKCTNEEATIVDMWKVKDIMIELVVNRTKYRARDVRKIEVEQSSSESSLLVVKIKMLVQNLIRDKWSESSDEATTNGFLAMLLMHINERLSTLHQFCVACDAPLIYRSVKKPSICGQPSCSSRIQTFISRGIADCDLDKVGEPQIPALLVTMAKAVAAAEAVGLREKIFKPFPRVVDPSNSDVLALNPKKPNLKRCMHAMSKLSDLSSESLLTYSELQNLDDKLSFPLLQSLIETNQNSYAYLSDTTRLDFVNAKHQFMLTRSTPTKEATFKTAKRLYGSKFAFHGSPIENWHSIIRNGLKNASGTNLELHGQRYGAGIYMSPNMCLAQDYTVHWDTEKIELMKKHSSHRCVALCEVIDHPDVKKSEDQHGIQIWVAPNPDYVCTRFLFVYENEDSDALEQDRKLPKINDANLLSEIQRVMLYYKEQM